MSPSRYMITLLAAVSNPILAAVKPATPPALTGAQQPSATSTVHLIGQELTPRTALFDRIVYGKNDAGQEIALHTTNRTLLIFLDASEDDEGKVGAITKTLLTALYQKPCPLLVTMHLLHNIFQPQSPRCSHLYDRAMLEKVREEFNPDQWLIVQPIDKTSPLLLMIPKAYLTMHAPAIRPSRPEYFASVYREALGLEIFDTHAWQISALEQWRAKFVGKPIKAPDDFGLNRLLALSQSGMEQVDQQQLFIRRDNYDGTTEPIPQWTIYITGHGAPGRLVAGIPITTFQRLLNYLSNEQILIAKLFSYVSCFSAGINRVLIYEEPNKDTPKIYQFPILAAGVTDAAVAIGGEEGSVTQAGGEQALVSMLPAVHYSSFVKFVEEDPYPYYNIAMMLFATSTKQLNVTNPFPPDSYPFIRPPRGEHFIPLLETVNLTPLLASTRAPTDTLSIGRARLHHAADMLGLERSKVCTPDNRLPISIMVTAPYVPFPLDLPLDPACTKYTIISGGGTGGKSPVMHVFTKITTASSPDLTTWEDSCWNIFAPLHYATPVTYYIAELELPTGGALYHVIVEILEGHTLIFFTGAQDKKFKILHEAGRASAKFGEINADYISGYREAIKNSAKISSIEQLFTSRKATATEIHGRLKIQPLRDLGEQIAVLNHVAQHMKS